MKRRGLPKWCSEFLDRHERPRVRARRKGYPTYYFKAPPGTVDFENEYRAWRDGSSRPAAGIGEARTRAGSVADVIAMYYRSTTWAGLAPATQRARRNILERFKERYGDKPIAQLEHAHIKKIIEDKVSTPTAGRHLLKMIRVLVQLAIASGYRRDDPTLNVTPVRVKTDGFHTWTESEIEMFEAKHPVGSRARLAFALLLYTGQRRGDVARMGWQHLRQGRIHLRQAKTGTSLAVAIHPALAVVLEAAPRAHLNIITTRDGRPFSSAGFGNWFRRCVSAAGLPDACSAHGLRKAAARRLAEAGCSASQIAAVTGHKSLREVERYTAAASQVAMADAAIAALGSQHEQKLATRGDGLAKTAEK